MAEMPSNQGIAVRFGRARPADAAEVFPLVYNELRSMAARSLRAERANHTLQPTALVHEAYLRLAGSASLDFRSKVEFVSLVAVQIRKILIDHARRRCAVKRGGGRPKRRLDDEQLSDSYCVDLIALDQALGDLAERSPRQSRVVELRFFGGMELPEIATLLGISRSTVKNDWRAARAWLAQHIVR